MSVSPRKLSTILCQVGTRRTVTLKRGNAYYTQGNNDTVAANLPRNPRSGDEKLFGHVLIEEQMCIVSKTVLLECRRHKVTSRQRSAEPSQVHMQGLCRKEHRPPETAAMW